MVLVELSTELRRDYMREPCDNLFVLSYCLRFKKLIVSSKAAIDILEKFLECLETRYSSLEPRCSIGSRIKDPVSSRDCQLTFARDCTLWSTFFAGKYFDQHFNCYPTCSIAQLFRFLLKWISSWFDFFSRKRKRIKAQVNIKT